MAMSRCFGGTAFTTRSPIRIVPRVMLSRPATIRRAVVFPHPDGPTRTMNSPSPVPKIELVHGDITEERVDAVVNAANSSLLGGGGVDGAIHRKGGATILRKCREIRRTAHPDGLPTGRAVATSAGNLPARWVIHTVGPVFSRSEDRPHGVD